jgi:hypothetical protein
MLIITNTSLPAANTDANIVQEQGTTLLLYCCKQHAACEQFLLETKYLNTHTQL